MATDAQKQNLFDPCELRFSVYVAGGVYRKRDVRLVLEADIKLMFEGTLDSSGGDVFIFKLPSLYGLIKPGVHTLKLEVLVDEHKFFVPVTSSIEFVEDVSVKSEQVNVNEKVEIMQDNNDNVKKEVEIMDENVVPLESSKIKLTTGISFKKLGNSYI